MLAAYACVCLCMCVSLRACLCVCVRVLLFFSLCVCVCLVMCLRACACRCRCRCTCGRVGVHVPGWASVHVRDGAFANPESAGSPQVDVPIPFGAVPGTVLQVNYLGLSHQVLVPATWQEPCYGTSLCRGKWLCLGLGEPPPYLWLSVRLAYKTTKDKGGTNLEKDTHPTMRT